MHGVAEGRGATKVSATATTSTDTSLRKLLSSDAGFAHLSRKCWPQWKKSPDPEADCAWSAQEANCSLAIPGFMHSTLHAGSRSMFPLRMEQSARGLV
jgi:hypothetical protein